MSPRDAGSIAVSSAGDGQTGTAAASTTCTTCPYCGVGCGILATPGPDGVAIAGDPKHPANLGRLCSKGSALGETLSLDGRILTPRLNGRDTGWDTAIGLVADRFRAAIETHGPDSVAFYVSGQLLTEDYYVANKLMKGFIGSANIDTNSRLCMASSVAGHKRAFGSDTVPGTYEDLEQADLIVLVGSNLAWCHPVLYQRIAAAKAERPEMKVVNIDPRRTATSDLSDMHLALRPGTDVALFNGLLDQINAQGAVDSEFVTAHVSEFPEALEAARAGNPAITGLTQEELKAFYDLWIRTEKVVTIYSQGVNQSTSGTDKVNAILNCHLATGRIGEPGMGPFSVTGQPNAMGGRETGGLANMLAAHLELSEPTHRDAVQAFWKSGPVACKPGLKAVDLFDACARGRIKALWVMSTNPAVSMPDANRVRDAIAACDFVVVSDIFPDTDTAKLADVILPATAWGEKSGTVTNSDRTISRQRPFLPSPGQARPDWQIICDVASAMGWREAFNFRAPSEIFREHAALSGVAGALGRDFDISGLADISEKEYEALEPVRWPVSATRSGGRFFGDGRFFTPNGRARMLPVQHRPMAQPTTEDRPFRLNTGRIRDHWHTMTRTARTPRLSQHMAEPYVEIHPGDAERLGIAAADLVRVASDHGAMIARALITDRTAQGEIFAPMHWTSSWASDGRVDVAVPANTDPVSGQPELKGAAVALEPLRPVWYAFVASRKEPAIGALPGLAYWARAVTKTGWRAELAGDIAPVCWESHARLLLGATPADETVSLIDQARGRARIVVSSGGTPLGAVFIDRSPVQVARSHVIAGLLELSAEALLAGRASADQPDPGAIVCSCMSVGANTIARAVGEHGLGSVEAIGEATGAGTSCGSCRPELRAFLLPETVKLAAE
ncbi:MAG: molybdopterin-dependent oxidoreductase [Pseudomonadota bacterium]